MFRHVDTAFTVRHIVSAASSETGIAGTLQHNVHFICVKESKSKKKNGISKNMQGF